MIWVQGWGSLAVVEGIHGADCWERYGKPGEREGVAVKGEMTTIKVLNGSYWGRGEEEERRWLFIVIVGELGGGGAP
jgi:hypothetical protein